MACQAPLNTQLAPAEGNRFDQHRSPLLLLPRHSAQNPSIIPTSPSLSPPPLLVGGPAAPAAMAMEHFQDNEHVWLRNHFHGTYLRADEDGHGVSLSSRKKSMKAAWAVHLYNEYTVLLRSAAYGRYLSSTDTPATSGCRGFRVALRDYNELDDLAIRWDPFRFGPGPEIMLSHDREDGVYGYLRGNGLFNLLNASEVSVDQGSTSIMTEWEVRPIPSRGRIPRLPRPPILHISFLDTSREMMLTGIAEVFLIEDFSFNFKGRSVFNLRKTLVNRLNIPADVANNLVMYVRAGAYGRFTPLVVDLPRSRQTLVITANTPANGPRYPDFEQQQQVA